MQNPRNAPAGFGVRWIAYGIDSLLVSFAALLCLLPVKLTSLFDESSIWNKQVLFHFTTYAIAVYLIRAVYFVVTTYAMGATLGKKLLRLQVETKDGEKLTFVSVLFRETVGRFLSGILYIGYLLALGREHLTLHDMLCDTRVCYKNLAEIVRVHVIPAQNAPVSPPNGGYVPPQNAPVSPPNGGYVPPQNAPVSPPNGEYVPPQNAPVSPPNGGYVYPQNEAPRGTEPALHETADAKDTGADAQDEDAGGRA